MEEVREGSGFAPKKLDKHFPGTDILWGQVLDLRYRLHDLVQHHYTIYEGYIIGLHYSRVLKGQIMDQLKLFVRSLREFRQLLAGAGSRFFDVANRLKKTGRTFCRESEFRFLFADAIYRFLRFTFGF